MKGYLRRDQAKVDGGTTTGSGRVGVTDVPLEQKTILAIEQAIAILKITDTCHWL